MVKACWTSDSITDLAHICHTRSMNHQISYTWHVRRWITSHLIMMDHFTKFTVENLWIDCENHHPDDVDALLLFLWLSTTDAFRDKWSCLKCEFFQEWCHSLVIKKLHIILYHPQVNVACERFVLPSYTTTEKLNSLETKEVEPFLSQIYSTILNRPLIHHVIYDCIQNFDLKHEDKVLVWHKGAHQQGTLKTLWKEVLGIVLP